MTALSNYGGLDATGLAAAVRAGDVTATELLEQAITRLDRVNPVLNAVITRMDDEGRRAAADPPDGPFRGVPFLLKDLLQEYAGFPMSSGSAALKKVIPESDSTVVERYKAAGLVTFGKTNVPEFGLVAVTEPAAFGPTRNPWDPSRSPGGSSGGSAAAVAAGVVPMASANDGGGSIRIPAAWCGLFGLKPSRGRVPVGPRKMGIREGTIADLVVSRTVRDSAAALDAIAGPTPDDQCRLPPPDRPFADFARQPPTPLRIGYTTRSPIGSTVDPACRKAVESTVDLLSDLGHEVEEAEPAVEGIAVARAYLSLYYGNVAADLHLIEKELGKEAMDGIEPTTRLVGHLGDSLSAAQHVEWKRRWSDFARAMADFHSRYDLYLTPTTASLPVKVGSLRLAGFERIAVKLVNRLRAGRLVHAAGIPDKLAMEQLGPVPFTQLANLTGQPAMSVPLHWSEDGLPCGSHFMAPAGKEALLFQLAGQLEAARPWADRRPAIWADGDAA